LLLAVGLEPLVNALIEPSNVGLDLIWARQLQTQQEAMVLLNPPFQSKLKRGGLVAQPPLGQLGRLLGGGASLQTVLGVAGTAGVWLFYVQHPFEESNWERRDHWDYTAAAMQGSSFYKLPGSCSGSRATSALITPSRG